MLLSGIAHELNNPLQAISGFSEILQRDPDLAPQARADLALIQKESARASAIIRNLSRFSRQQGSTPRRSSCRATSSRRSSSCGSAGCRSRASVSSSTSARRQPTHAVFTELQQVLLNFVINAEQSLVAAADRRRPPHHHPHDATARAGIRLEVEDTGAGVRRSDESKLFQPFFTTKPVGEGTGLGLSVSYGIMRSFGGTIGYRRGALGGALFYFELPGMSASSPPMPTARP